MVKAGRLDTWADDIPQHLVYLVSFYYSGAIYIEEAKRTLKYVYEKFDHKFNKLIVS